MSMGIHSDIHSRFALRVVFSQQNDPEPNKLRVKHDKMDSIYRNQLLHRCIGYKNFGIYIEQPKTVRHTGPIFGF